MNSIAWSLASKIALGKAAWFAFDTHITTQGVAQGLEFLHSRGRLHRDLKTANVLVMQDFPKAHRY